MMRISDFLKRYNLHGSLINNVEYDSTTKRVSIETELCKWQQFDYDETKDPEMIEGFIVFEDVTYFETDCVDDRFCCHFHGVSPPPFLNDQTCKRFIKYV